MKNLFIYLFTITLFCSCDIDYCSVYIIKNSTNKKLKLYLKNKVIELNKTYILQNEKCTLGGIPPLDISEYDSIYITDINNVVLITYKPNIFHDEDPNCKEKNIYNYSCWFNEEISNDNYENTFEIKNDDLE